MIKTLTKTSGAVYTPPYIVKNILDLSGYRGIDILRKHVIDNSCGDGAFLTEIVSRYCSVTAGVGMPSESTVRDLETYVHGVEINRDEAEKCVKNLDAVAASFGLGKVRWDVTCADTLTVSRYDGKMDFVLGNPPYVRVHNFGDSFDAVKRFSFAQEGMTDLYIVFFEIGLRMLAPMGVLGYITPSSYFNSLAGTRMRERFAVDNLVDKVVDLKHYQAFDATTYTAITVLKKNKTYQRVEYYDYDADRLIPTFVENLTPDDYYFSGRYFFGEKKDIELVKKILTNKGRSGIDVKNGYATLCDSVFVNDFKFSSKYIIPVIKASTGSTKKIFFPYDINSRRIPMSEICRDKDMYEYLCLNRDRLLSRSNDNDAKDWWHLFGRSQGVNDTYRDKLAINTLLRTSDDWKIVFAPAGTGVYGGLYVTSASIDYADIEDALKSDEFISYVTLLGKYKSGGYYTFSSKDVKAFLDYKFPCDGGAA